MLQTLYNNNKKKVLTLPRLPSTFTFAIPLYALTLPNFYYKIFTFSEFSKLSTQLKIRGSHYVKCVSSFNSIADLYPKKVGKRSGSFIPSEQLLGQNVLVKIVLQNFKNFCSFLHQTMDCENKLIPVLAAVVMKFRGMKKFIKMFYCKK